MTNLEKFNNWLLEKQLTQGKPGWHAHDAWARHPVRVIDHANYFSTIKKIPTQKTRTHFEHIHPRSGLQHKHIVSLDNTNHYHANHQAYDPYTTSNEDIERMIEKLMKKDSSLQSKWIKPAAKRPKMSSHGGKTWDSISITLPDGTKTEGYVDTTWGQNVYFKHKESNKWYKIPVDAIGENWSIDLATKE